MKNTSFSIVSTVSTVSNYTKDIDNQLDKVQTDLTVPQYFLTMIVSF